MLLRVEVVPTNQNSQSQTVQGNHVSMQPKFVNLRTASHHRNGTLLHVGRKDSDLSFQNGKSLSRSHCRLRIVSSSGKTSSKAEEENAESIEGNEPLSPKTEEEQRACNSAVDGLVIVLDDLGR